MAWKVYYSAAKDRFDSIANMETNLHSKDVSRRQVLALVHYGIGTLADFVQEFVVGGKCPRFDSTHPLQRRAMPVIGYSYSKVKKT